MIRVLTDSVSDISPQTAQELGITVVPLHVRFGEEDYLDRVTISSHDFYLRLVNGSVHPTTSTASPAEFAAAFDKLAEETNEVLAITISSKFSVTYEAALEGRGLMQKKDCRVEVIDSQNAVMALGFAVIAAAEAARLGKSMEEVCRTVYDVMPKVHILACFDTLEYLRRGGRIGKAAAFLGSVLKVNPTITLENGTVEPVSRERGRARAIERLIRFAEGFRGRIAKLAVEYADYGSTIDEARDVVRRLEPLLPPGKEIYMTNVSPAIGTHTGPGLMVVSVQER